MVLQLLFTSVDRLPLGSTSHFEAEGDPSNAIISELPTVPEPSTAMHGMETAIDDITQSFVPRLLTTWRNNPKK